MLTFVNSTGANLSYGRRYYSNTAVGKRYKINSYEDIPNRMKLLMDRIDPVYSGEFHRIIAKKLFIPAGNTITCGINDKLGQVRPNCSILPPIHEGNYRSILDRAIKLWHNAIGVGFDLSKANDPVKILRDLSSHNREIDLHHRPQRGNIAILDANHPKVNEFIRCKGQQYDKKDWIYNFNISVSINDQIIDRERILLQIAENSYKSGDPGLLYIDNLRRNQPCVVPGENPITTLVPCGEQGMYADETCNLGSINLNANEFLSSTGEFQEEKLKQTIKLSVRFLDNVVDMLYIPDPIMDRKTKTYRRIGLGIMGWADLLEKLKIKYDSETALEMVDYIGRMFDDAVKDATKWLANERGGLTFAPERRNITVSCIAPTGGITLLTNNKGWAIEPFFEQSIKIKPIDHLKMQSKWQKYIENSISKTINLPNNSTVDEIKDIYQMAEEMGCNSVTVYRDGCQENQPISVVGGFEKKECSKCS